MPIYEGSEYLPILTSSIRADVVVPFDCFLYLQANGRIVLFLKSGNVFPADKLEKFKSFKVSQINIKKADEPIYAEYLRGFFKTPEGQAVYQALQYREVSESYKQMMGERALTKLQRRKQQQLKRKGNTP